MKKIENLENVEIGDSFGVHRYAWRIVKCDKVSKKQCVIDGITYRKKDAEPLGKSKLFLYENCDEIKEKMRKDLLINVIDVRRVNIKQWNETDILELKRLIDKQTEQPS